MTICEYCSTEEEVAAQVRTTLVHEVAHHFGISDPRLVELGW
jgi:predicted Zn-dependent protease with MMP-like domain